MAIVSPLKRTGLYCTWYAWALHQAFRDAYLPPNYGIDTHESTGGAVSAPCVESDDDARRDDRLAGIFGEHQELPTHTNLPVRHALQEVIHGPLFVLSTKSKGL